MVLRLSRLVKDRTHSEALDSVLEAVEELSSALDREVKGSNLCFRKITQVCMGTQSCLTLCHPWTVTHPAPLSTGFPGQEYWSGLPFPSPGIFSTQGLKPRAPALQADSLPLSHLGSPDHSRGNVKDGPGRRGDGREESKQDNCLRSLHQRWQTAVTRKIARGVEGIEAWMVSVYGRWLGAEGRRRWGVNV